jgi:hypothetical protein
LPTSTPIVPFPWGIRSAPRTRRYRPSGTNDRCIRNVRSFVRKPALGLVSRHGAWDITNAVVISRVRKNERQAGEQVPPHPPGRFSRRYSRRENKGVKEAQGIAGESRIGAKSQFAHCIADHDRSIPIPLYRVQGRSPQPGVWGRLERGGTAPAGLERRNGRL